MSRRAVVWRFPIRPGMGTIELPKGSVVLSAGYQAAREVPVADTLTGASLWAEVCPDEPVRMRARVQVVGTGHEVVDPEAFTFVGTFSPDGFYQFHVFVEAWDHWVRA